MVTRTNRQVNSKTLWSGRTAECSCIHGCLSVLFSWSSDPFFTTVYFLFMIWYISLLWLCRTNGCQHMTTCNPRIDWTNAYYGSMQIGLLYTFIITLWFPGHTIRCSNAGICLASTTGFVVVFHFSFENKDKHHKCLIMVLKDEGKPSLYPPWARDKWVVLTQ